MEIVLVTAISSITGIVIAWMLNNNWFKRQDARHRYLIKRYKLKQDYGLLNKQKKGSTRNEGGGGLDLMQIAKNLGLESDQIQNILDTIQDSQDGQEEESESIVTPELVQGILNGLNQGKNNQNNNKDLGDGF